MILRLALGSGLRKEELATFPVAYVFNPDRRDSDSRNVKIHLDPSDGHGIKTKGDIPRVIFVTRELMRDLYHYLVHYRGERASLSQDEQPPLFLNQYGKPFAASGKSLDRIVRMTGKKVGLHVWTHLLRHTYATHTLVALQHNRTANRLEPLVFLQNQLGHASPYTTLASRSKRNTEPTRSEVVKIRAASASPSTVCIPCVIIVRPALMAHVAAPWPRH